MVLDASAVLALLQREEGSEVVERALAGARMSAVNLAEVVGKAVERGLDAESLASGLAALGLRLEPFTVRQAEIAGALVPRTRALGLSLGDRACLALGLEADLPVLAADRAWRVLDPLPEIRLIR